MPEEQEQQGQDIVVELVNRVRILESKYSLMSERLLIVNQNMIEHHKKLMKDFRAGEMEIKDIKNDLEKVKNILKHLSEEAANFARKDEIKLLEKYIKMWNPINFITETDVKNLLQRELRRIEEGKPEPVEVKKEAAVPKQLKKEKSKNGFRAKGEGARNYVSAHRDENPDWNP